MNDLYFNIFYDCELEGRSSGEAAFPQRCLPGLTYAARGGAFHPRALRGTGKESMYPRTRGGVEQVVPRVPGGGDHPSLDP